MGLFQITYFSGTFFKDLGPKFSKFDTSISFPLLNDKLSQTSLMDQNECVADTSHEKLFLTPFKKEITFKTLAKTASIPLLIESFRSA
jgi:hypothetical protein